MRIVSGLMPIVEQNSFRLKRSGGLQEIASVTGLKTVCRLRRAADRDSGRRGV